MNRLALSLSGMLLAACQVPLAFQGPAPTGAVGGTGAWGAMPSEASSSPTGQLPQSPDARQGTQASTPPTADSPLLDWQGGVVEAPRQGTVHEVSRVGSRGLQESVEGRMHIIELYQSVLDERDQLLTEVDALQGALEKAQQEIQEAQDKFAELTTRADALEEAKKQLLAQNKELADRLTTAQLRRLEAEKLLLETQLAWHQEKSEAAAKSVAQRLSGGAKE